MVLLKPILAGIVNYIHSVVKMVKVDVIIAFN